MSKLGPNEPCHCGSGKKYKKCHMHKDAMHALRRPPSRQPTVVAGTQSPRRAVPSDIPAPDYAETGIPARRRGQNLIKDAEQITRMRAAGRLARRVLDTVCAAVRPGITTDALDAIAHETTIAAGAYPSPLNYHGFPKSICTSVNEVICHGIPDDRPLQDGDIVNCDITVYLDGMHGDCSRTVLVGSVDDDTQKLVEVTRQALDAGISVVRPGGHICDIGQAIEAVVRPHGYGVVHAFVGHGIGEQFHIDPQVPHYYSPKDRMEMRSGMTFTIEPMINRGKPGHRLWGDQWTAVTEDLLPSAQFEHTLLVTDTGVDVLTDPDA